MTGCDIENSNKTLDELLTNEIYNLHVTQSINQSEDKIPVVLAKVLLDSGATQSIGKYSVLKKLQFKKSLPTLWHTTNGSFKTSCKCCVEFMIPELSTTPRVAWDMHVTKQGMSYDLIIGRDLLQELGIVLDFKNNTIQWEDVEMPMKSIQQTQSKHFHIQEDKFYPSKSERIKKILEAKYQPANLKEVIQEASHLNMEEQQKVYKLLRQFELLFDGTVGKWEGVRADITLKPGVKPYHAKPADYTLWNHGGHYMEP